MEPKTDLITKQQIGEFARSEMAKILPEILKRNRSQIYKMIGKDQFQTVVNALTIEVESEFIARVLIYLNNAKEGKIL